MSGMYLNTKQTSKQIPDIQPEKMGREEVGEGGEEEC